MSKPTSIYKRRLTNAASQLEPHVYQLYEEYGLAVCLTVLQYMTAKGITGSGLTAREKAALIKKVKVNLDKFISGLNKS